MYFVYILKCADGSFYTGITTDLKRRLEEHNGKVPGGAKYTRARRPVTLVFQEQFVTRSAALKREHEIKSLTRVQKEELIK